MSTPDERENAPEPTPAEPTAYQPAPSTEPTPAEPTAPAAPAAASSPQAGPQATPPPAQPYAQPGAQQPGYAAAPPPPAYQRPPGQAGAKTWMNITSFVTSILGLGLVGVIFGHLGVSASNRGEAELKGLGIAGLIIGYLQIVLGIIAIVIGITLFVSCANDPQCVDFWTQLDQEINALAA
ncbi:DUF4190 domain-containing protein [Demequina phytophila]|uniref:DUF4190 domain-containing protein n=1 Tax=Demequina phytophila TaxID=1638981 RepID=UPI000AEC4745|nr:DUF4190 domain-containing protein [Demequina phytophila]